MGGECVGDGRCVCDGSGYETTDESTKRGEPPCSTRLDPCTWPTRHDCFNGRCRVDEESWTPTCSCNEGWGGPLCTLPDPCAAHPCHGGQCCWMHAAPMSPKCRDVDYNEGYDISCRCRRDF